MTDQVDKRIQHALGVSEFTYHSALCVGKRDVSESLRQQLSFPGNSFKVGSRKPFWDVFEDRKRILVHDDWIQYKCIESISLATRKRPGTAAFEIDSIAFAANEMYGSFTGRASIL
jgi:hypothetical protein